MAGAAGQDEHALDLSKDLGRIGPEESIGDTRGLHDHLQGGRHRAGLLGHLLLHVVLVGAKCDIGIAQGASDDGPLHGPLSSIAELTTHPAIVLAGKTDSVAVLQVDHVTGDLQQCRGI